MNTHEHLAGQSSQQRMRSIRAFAVPENSFALWFLGQNGFLFKSPAGTLIAIDPYLSDYCGETYTDQPFSLSRVPEIPIRPEDLDVDAILFTHSHADHVDEATLRHIPQLPTLIGPWEALERVRSWDLPAAQTQLLHAGQTIPFAELLLKGTFSIPTDGSDVNHIGVLITLPNGLTFYNTGDTAYAPVLERIVPKEVDVCAICMNGAFQNLTASEAASLIKIIQPKVAIPTHFDMMRCNLADPETFRIALLHHGSTAKFHRMSYDEVFVYRRQESSSCA